MAKKGRQLEDSLIEDLNFMKEWALRHVLLTDNATKQKIENIYKSIRIYLIKQKKNGYKYNENGRTNKI